MNGELDRLRRLLGATFPTASQRAYIDERWYSNALQARRKWTVARRWFYGCRVTALGSGTLLPAVVSWQTAHPNETWPALISIALSLVTAMTSGILQLTGAQERFRLRGVQLHRLESTGWRLLSYEPPDIDAFDLFRRQVEEALDIFDRAAQDLIVSDHRNKHSPALTSEAATTSDGETSAK